MKQYTKHYENSRRGSLIPQIDVQKAVPVEGTDVRKAVGRTAPTAFLTADSTKTHVLTSEMHEWKDNYLENAFKEWEQWLQNYRLRLLQRKPNQPYTPTDFDNHSV